MFRTATAQDPAVEQRAKEYASRGLDTNVGKAEHAALGKAQGSTDGGCQAEPWREPLIVRLQREADSYGDQASRKLRAVELLLLHPEFEDLIELLRIINIY